MRPAKKSFKRSLRVQDRLREDISELLQKKVKDPRIGFGTVTEVSVTDDLRNAKVYISVLGNEKVRAEAMEGIQSSAGFIQREVWKHLEIKARPELRFLLDETAIRAAKMDETFRKMKEEGEL